MQTKKVVSVSVLLPTAPRVSPVIPQCTVPVLFNSSSESKLYSSNTDLGKLSCLSCSKLNIITVPCAVPSQPSLLSPTTKNYVYVIAKSLLSTPRPTLALVVKPPVVTSLAFDNPNVVVAESSAPPTTVAEPPVTNLSSSPELFFRKLFHPHQYKPDRLDELIQTTAKQFHHPPRGEFLSVLSEDVVIFTLILLTFYTQQHTS